VFGVRGYSPDCNPATTPNIEHQTSNPKLLLMFRNYIKIAWRNMFRNKTNSIINIAGLSIGIACVILITMFVQDEKQYDRVFSNADRIYQVNLDAVMGGQAAYISNTPPTVGPALKRTFPEIETYTRFFVMGREVISTENGLAEPKHFTESNFLAVDSNFLQVFDYQFKQGNANSCFLEPHSIVLTETTAKKYFGNTDPLGKNLVLDEYHEPFKVTAVLKDLPTQASIQFDLLIPTSACPPVKRFSWSWIWCQVNTYVLLNKTAAADKQSMQTLESKFPEMVRTQAATAFKRIGQPFDEFIKKGGKWDFHLMPLTDVHLHSTGISSPFLSTLGDIKYVYIFSAIALFIMVLACVNFMNLSTAQSARRAKEVGIRKVLGSKRKQLIRQFLSEALLYSFISAIIALFLVALLLPLFNTVSGKTLVFSTIFRSGTWAFVIFLTIVTGLLAGSYPAFYLTAFNPVTVLKGSFFSKSISNLFVRNGLVVFQFTVSIALIICTVIVFQQLKYTKQIDMGLKKDNVVIIPNAEKMENNAAEVFRQQITGMRGVAHASISSSIPTANAFGDFYVPEINGVKEPLAKDIGLSSFMVDESFIPSLNIQVIKGRNFSTDFNDSSSVIVNEATVKQIGWKEPLGKFITYSGNNNQRFQVIGVVKDFNVESIRSAIGPFALFNLSSKTYRINTSFIIAKINGDDVSGTLQQLEAKWKQLAPSIPFEYSFLDKNFENLYRADQKQGFVFGIFTCLSIIVACLGLFGLSMYTAERRTKEIGIRKVLGASVESLVALLSKEFIKLVCLSVFLAFPIGWWAMNKWLQDFTYHINISWTVFVLAGLGSLYHRFVNRKLPGHKIGLAEPG
jgi:putative ABC transport system permease protein